MRRFALVANSNKDLNLSLSEGICEYLRKNGCECAQIPELSGDMADGDSYHDYSVLHAETECLIVLGGDGTMLAAARGIEGSGIPMLGINLGSLGFLASIEKNDVYAALDRLIADDYVIEERMMIKAEIKAGEKTSICHCLNDVAITRSGFSRLIAVELKVNGRPVFAYEGDGLIISTPTGSTGYNMSAGGPLVSPRAKLIALTPVCPHSLSARSMIISSEDRAEITVVRRRKSLEEEANVTVDGVDVTGLKVSDSVVITASPRVTRFVRFDRESFYGLVHSKLEPR